MVLFTFSTHVLKKVLKKTIKKYIRADDYGAKEVDNDVVSGRNLVRGGGFESDV